MPCPSEHICLFCQHPSHGLSFLNSDETYKCPRRRALDRECAPYGDAITFGRLREAANQLIFQHSPPDRVSRVVRFRDSGLLRVFPPLLLLHLLVLFRVVGLTVHRHTGLS
jgi:hypothetical protein